MDIHAPEEPVRNWRDFFTHIAIVTIGLFIALMLEALVEYGHHRHIVHEARTNIRVELENNHQQIQQDLIDLQQNMVHVKANVTTLQQIRLQPHKHYSLTNTMTWTPMEEAAWRTARDTGALALMPYDEVQRDSDIYTEAENINRRAQAITDVEFSALAPVYMGYDVTSLPPEEMESMLRDNAQAEMDLLTMQQFLKELDASIEKTLKQ